MAVVFGFELEIPEGMGRLKMAAYRRARKEAWETVFKWWVTDRLKHRFDGTMQGPLGWAKRSEKYDKRKSRFRASSAGKAHRFSGKTAGRIARNTSLVVRPSQVRFVMTALNWFYKRRRKGIDGNAEITRLSTSEVEQMAVMYAEELRRLIYGNAKAFTRIRKKIDWRTSTATVEGDDMMRFANVDA